MMDKASNVAIAGNQGDLDSTSYDQLNARHGFLKNFVLSSPA